MNMLKFTIAACLFGSAAAVGGCAYGGVAAVDDDTVVIVRNDAFLFGLLRSVHVCQVADTGLTSCQSDEKP